MVTSISLTGWRNFRAERDPNRIRVYLNSVGRAGQSAFKKGMMEPKSGRHWPMNRRRSSAPGEWPASQSGRLMETIRFTAKAGTARYLSPGTGEVTIGTSMPYSKALREGGGKIARRKMSDDALHEGMEASRDKLKGWVRWKRY